MELIPTQTRTEGAVAVLSRFWVNRISVINLPVIISILVVVVISSRGYPIA